MCSSIPHLLYDGSAELRNRKPYAIPVQCLPYASLREQDMRRMVNNLIEEMVKLGMNIAGMCDIFTHAHAYIHIILQGLLAMGTSNT